jgi:glycosyltransferase involved in cell wall biosynthesis
MSRVGVVTPWYPSEGSVYLGSFVEQQVEAVRSLGWHVDVEVLQLFPSPDRSIPDEVIDAMERLADRDDGALYRRYREATWIPAPVPVGGGAFGRVEAFAAALERKRRRLPVDVDVVHAHLGVPVGAALLGLDSHPLVVTEHQSTLASVLAERPARGAYGEVVRRASRFFVVSEHLATLIVDAVGSWAADRIEVMPNIVDLSDIERRERASVGRCWLYVGALIRTKGVRELVEAFLSYRKRYDAEATLTLVGAGAERAWIEHTLGEADALDAVDLVGSVPRAQLGPYLDRADVYVHMSPAETFGIASLEAIGAGLPVVSFANGGAEAAWGSIEAQAGRILDSGADPGEVADAVAGLGSGRELDPVAARAFVEQHYSVAAVGQRLIDVYTEAQR